MDNELTVKVFNNYDEIVDILNRKGYKIIEIYTVDDIYMINKDIDISKLDNYQILSKCLLLRNIDGELVLVYKNKEYASNGDIINQYKVKCRIESIENARKILEMVGFIPLITIKDKITVLSDGNIEINIQEVDDQGMYLEIEMNKYHEGNHDEEKKEKIIEYLNNLGLNIGNNYYEKKAFVALDRTKQKRL